jgi:MOSC domain-containing protein YiiM
VRAGRVVQVSVSPKGGVPKLPVEQAEVGVDGLVGDAVRYTKIHGGPERAVCLFPLELIETLRAEGHPVFPGSTGENLTLAGLDWPALEPGDVVAVGASVRLQLTTRVEPCKTIRDSFAGGDFKRIKPSRVPGETRWYTRVLAGGTVRPGDVVAVEPAA